MALVVLLVLLGSGSFWALAASHPAGPAAPSGASGATAALVPPATHGDLVVTAGETYWIRPTATSHTYYQGGNITVEAGGTLNVVNVSLTFVEFVADTGTAQSRLSHVLHFTDAGAVHFWNSTLTTDVHLLNAYAKLWFSVTGTLDTWNTTFAYPGWLFVTGASAIAVFNDSIVRGNPDVMNVSEPGDIQGDTEYAPTLDASGGAQVDLFGSQYRQIYADNFDVNGFPTTAPLGTIARFQLPGTGSYVVSDLTTPTDSANLTRDYAYPNGISGATVSAIYSNKVNISTTASVAVEMNGKSYSFGNITFGGPVAGALALANSTAPFVTALNAAGLLEYLNWTGAFGAGPLEFSIHFANISGTAINVSEAWITLYPDLSFNIGASGAGTTLNAVNTAFGVTWNTPPASEFQIIAPYPWFSNKLTLTSGATAFLANITAVSSIPGVFSSSAVLTDAASKAYFYRWAAFNITGRGGHLPIPGARATAFYAYNQNQSNNATANALNQLSTSSPPIWSYVQYWDGQHGLPAYGETGRSGKAFLLLAVGNLTGATLPDGIFLGGYHIGVTAPIAAANNQWFNWSLQPYPSGVANGTSNYGGPDHGPTVTFDGYFSSLTAGTIGLSQNGTALVANTVWPARTLGIDVPLTNTGTAEIFNLTGTLYYGPVANGVVIATIPLENLSLQPGGVTWANFSWYVTSHITGISGVPNQLFSLNISYNAGNATLGGGYIPETATVSIAPYFGDLAVASVTVEANGTPLVGDTVRIGQSLDVHVVLNYSGTVTLTNFGTAFYYAPLNLTAKPVTSLNVTSLLHNPGQQTSYWLNWTVNDTVVGLEGKTFLHNFTVAVVWFYGVDNLGIINLVLNNTARLVPISVAPSQVKIVSWLNPPPSTLNLNDQYVTRGVLRYNGSQEALLKLVAYPTSGTGVPVTIGTGASFSGNYSFFWVGLQNILSPGTSYSLELTATYNGVVAYYNLTGPFSVPSSSSAPGFFFQTFLGLPLWMWLAIVAAIAVAIVAVLLVSRRQAAGKLVECGECGNLIPEDATVCPKCGAEFESDLIRCSRCASTIPANSQFCPECAAQLLGKPGEGEADPERQGYSDFTERYRTEAKKELGENYNEGSFWDWWKRQPTYTSFSQWKLQQGQGASRAGMSAPPLGTATAEPAAPARAPGAGQPPKSGGGAAAAAMPAAAAAAPPRTAPGAPPAAPPAPAPGALKPCPNCGKEIPPEYLVCPFCGSVTQ